MAVVCNDFPVRLDKLEELSGARAVSYSGGVLVCFTLQLALLLLDVRELLLPRLLVWFLLLLTRRHSCGHQEKRLQSWLKMVSLNFDQRENDICNFETWSTRTAWWSGVSARTG